MSGDEALAEGIKRDWRSLDLPPRLRALVSYADRITSTPSQMSDQDIAELRAQGLSDEAILDATRVAAYFNYINRIADALGVRLENGELPR